MNIRLDTDGVIVISNTERITKSDPKYKEVLDAYCTLLDNNRRNIGGNFNVKLFIFGPLDIITDVCNMTNAEVQFEKSPDDLRQLIYFNTIRGHMVTHYIHELLKKIYTKYIDVHLRQVLVDIDNECYDAEFYNGPCYFKNSYMSKYFGKDEFTSDTYEVYVQIYIEKTDKPVSIDYSNDV